MAHLKLGVYSFSLDGGQLGLTAGTGKRFLKDDLPENLKSLFDIVSSNKINEKPLYICFKSDDLNCSGFMTQTSITSFAILSGDGILVSFESEIVDSINYINITYYVY